MVEFVESLKTRTQPATSCSITHPVGIFLANGRGGFTDGSSMWDGPPARTEHGRQILIADFNGDHRNDIFVADHGYRRGAVSRARERARALDPEGNARRRIVEPAGRVGV